MGKLYERLHKQLETEFKQDAENCLKIYDKLKEIDNGRVWESKWRALVDTIYKGFPSDKRRFKPTNIGYIFLKGIE
jgi:hypothetical protein